MARADKASQGINEAASKVAQQASKTGDAVEQGIRQAAQQVKEGAPQAADVASQVRFAGASGCLAIGSPMTGLLRALAGLLHSCASD